MSEKKSVDKLKAVVLGCGMGRAHAHSIANCEDYQLVAICDLNRDAAVNCAKENGIDTVYTDYAKMLAEIKPDVVAVATPSDLHVKHTLQAVEAGAKGINCEKPMAVFLGEAKLMVKSCKDAGVSLIINHQRRLGTDLVYARQLIKEGALGEIRMIRGECAGDILSDGTHLVDSISWLAGDPGAEWVTGMVNREGNLHRYGHSIESGAMAVIQLKNSIRAEIFSGNLRSDKLAYQDYKVIGSKATLWRCGDRRDTLFISDSQGGEWTPGLDGGVYKPIPSTDSKSGLWRPVEIPIPHVNSIAEAYKLLAASIKEGKPHPMSGENALVGFEILMAVFESARLHKRIRFPIDQDRYPLDVMIEQGIL